MQQEIGVGVREQCPHPHEDAAEHGVLDGAAREVAARGDAAVDVRELVEVDPAPEPQLLDVGIADGCVLDLVERIERPKRSKGGPAQRALLR